MIKQMFFHVFNVKEYNFKKLNIPMLFIIIILGSIGMYLMKILQDPEDPLFERQLIGYLLGLFVALFVSLIDYHFICRMYIPLYLISLGLLLICKFVDSGPVYGWSHFKARRWIKIGGDPLAGIHNTGFEFQPSELTKIVMIIFLAKLFDLLQKKIKKVWVLLLASACMALPTYLIFTQTDFSTSMLLLAVFAVIVFLAGVSYKVIVPIIALTIPAVIALFWYIQQDFQVLLDKYQKNRIMAMLYPKDYPQQAYQQENAAAAIRSGGTVGKFLSDDPTNLGAHSVPVSESDFIFSAIAEYFGFIGSCIILILFAVLIILIFRIALRAKDHLGKLLAMGIGSLITIQVFFNIGVVTSLLPNTGLPLPFVSSGLTSLVSSMLMVGILLNIGMQPKEVVVQEDDIYDHINLN